LQFYHFIELMENTKFYLFSQGECRRDGKVVMRTAGSMLGGWPVLYSSRQKKCPQDERIVEKAIGDPEDTHQNWLGTSYSSGDKARAYKVARSRRRRTLCRILSPGKLAVSHQCELQRQKAHPRSPGLRSGRPHTTAQKSCRHPVHEHDRLTKLGGRGGRATQPRRALCYRNDVQRDRISINMTY